MKKYILLIVYLLFVLIDISSQTAGPEYIGSLITYGDSTTDTMPVSNVKNIYTSLYIKITGVPLKISGINITFDSGDIESIPVKFNYSEGSSEQNVKLKKKGILEKIVFCYKPKTAKSTIASEIRIFGIR
jgi:hypothetical protein